MAFDRTALTAGLSGLALATVSALVRALVVAVLKAHGASLTWAIVVFAGVSLTGFCLGVLAIWSAIKAWLRDDALSVPARWGAALGLAAMLFVVATGPCGSRSCPG